MSGSATKGAPSAQPRPATAANGADRPDELLMFGLSGRRFALGRAHVHSLLPMAALAPPSNGPPLLVGFLMLPDLALPVLNLALLLGLPQWAPTPATALLRLKGASPRALMVDRAIAIVRPDADAWREVPAEHSFAGVLGAEVLMDGESCGVLLPDRLLLREEEDRLEAFRAEAEARREALVRDHPEETAR